MKLVKLEDVCYSGSSNISQKDVMILDGSYPIYGASGFIKNINFYKSEKPYIAIVKDGSGVGRTMILPEKSSVIGTMQYIFPRDNIDIRYLYYAITSMDLSKYCTGIAIPHIYFKDYKKEKLNLPSISEQVNIANKLDLVQKIIDLKQQQIKNLDELIKSQFVEMFGDVATNTKNYKKVKLSEISEYWNGLTYKPTDVVNNGVVVLRSSNIQNGKLDFKDIVKVNCKIADKKFVKDKDILMCSRNGSARLVGKVALIDEITEPMSFGAFMMIIRSKYYPYLLSYFETDAFRNQISTGATTTINQITSNMMNRIELPLPPENEINEFERIVKLIDKQKFILGKSLKETEELKKSLMNKYFG